MEAASIEELHQKIQTLEKENNKEEEYRNYMQLERVSSGQTTHASIHGSCAVFHVSQQAF